MPILLAGLGGQEILYICLAAVILFGATKVPQFMKGIGQGVREFKQAVRDTPEDGAESPSSNAAPPETVNSRKSPE